MSVNFDRNKCLTCAGCISICPKNALTFTKMRPEVDPKLCINCSICVRFCPVGAITLQKKS